MIAPRVRKVKPTRTAEFVARSGRDWRNIIEAAIPDGPLRGAVFAIAWWDHFAIRAFSKRWADLDEFFIKRDDNASYAFASGVSPEELCQGLIAIGYDPNEAVQRSRDPADAVRRDKRRAEYLARKAKSAPVPRAERRNMGPRIAPGQGTPQGAV